MRVSHSSAAFSKERISSMHSVLTFLYWLLVFVECVVGIALIYIVTIQESKNDGLAGQIGSTTSTSSFKGKAGREEQLNLLTKNISIVFFVIAAIVAYGTGRWQ
jgi:protein translocase SecG subunit